MLHKRPFLGHFVSAQVVLPSLLFCGQGDQRGVRRKSLLKASVAHACGLLEAAILLSSDSLYPAYLQLDQLIPGSRYVLRGDRLSRI